MNNTFNFNRFGLLVKRQWLELGKIYLISLVVVTGVFVLFYSWNFPDSEKGYQYNSNGFLNLYFRIPMFLTLGFIFISIIASNYFSMLGQKPKAIIELMVPASSLEKWLCGLFYTSILGIFSFLLLFYIIDLAFVTSIEKSMGHVTYNITSGVDSSPKTGIVSVRTLFAQILEHKQMVPIYAIPFVITSVFLLGSVYFNRFHYIKTAVVTMLFGAALTYAMIKMSQWMTANKVSTGSYGPVEKDHFIAFVLIGMGAITFFLWTITFFRIKEKEV